MRDRVEALCESAKARCEAAEARVLASRDQIHKVRLFMTLMGERQRMSSELFSARRALRRATPDPSAEEVESVFRALTRDF